VSFILPVLKSFGEGEGEGEREQPRTFAKDQLCPAFLPSCPPLLLFSSLPDLHLCVFPEQAVRRKSMVGRDPHAIHIEVAIHKLESNLNKTHAQGRRQSDHDLPSSVVDEIERIK